MAFSRRGRTGTVRAPRALLIIENVSLARDHRARKQVASLLSAGYRVGVICRRDPQNARHRAPGLRLYEYAPPPEGGKRAAFAFEYAYSLVAAALLSVRALADGRYQVIQAGHPPDIYFLIALLAKLVRVRFVVDQRDLSPEVYADRYGTGSRAVPALLRAFEQASWKVADHILLVNDSLRRATVNRGHVDASKVSVVGNGPTLASIAPPAADPQLREGRRRLVCWVGLMGPQDRIELALSAVSHYVHELQRRDALFAFIGDGEVLPVLRDEAVRLRIQDVARFCGWLDQEDCFRYLATADLGLDCNMQPEVTPVKGLEYMAHGLPFVAFDLPETRAAAGSAARYVRPGESGAMAAEIARLIDAPGERREMGRVGRQRIMSQFAWDRQESTYLSVYERLVGAPSREVRHGLPPRPSRNHQENAGGRERPIP
jgi:glycosyltransferase involved in cell wall biosynthesis